LVALPEAEPGLVVRYDYLWSHQNAADQGKDRPVCIIAAIALASAPLFVVLLPVTHSRPVDEQNAIEIPERVRRAIGRDDQPSWVVVSEYNIDSWPNGGLSPSHAAAGRFEYGLLPPALFHRIKVKFWQ
jgi:hypothetical protein